MTIEELKKEVSRTNELELTQQDNMLDLKNEYYETEIKFDESFLRDKKFTDILKLSHQGRNVEHITRVTGYFSKIENWNKGKKAEFSDRYRTKNCQVDNIST